MTMLERSGSRTILLSCHWLSDLGVGAEADWCVELRKTLAIWTQRDAIPTITLLQAGNEGWSVVIFSALADPRALLWDPPGAHAGFHLGPCPSRHLPGHLHLEPLP